MYSFIGSIGTSCTAGMLFFRMFNVILITSIEVVKSQHRNHIYQPIAEWIFGKV